jgi:hypothetical protein
MTYQVIMGTWDTKGDLVESLKDEEKALSLEKRGFLIRQAG